MNKHWKMIWWFLKIILGSTIFSLGFDLFLAPYNFNAGGLSGLAQILVNLTGFGSVGVVTAIINLPLFFMGGKKIGKKFFFGSLLGMVSLSGALELFVLLPVPVVDPLLAVLYGGCICGVGLGMVFVSGASTGGSDIIVRLLQRKWQHIPIGTISIAFDAVVAILTGIVTRDLSRTLYTGLVVFLTGKVIDMVVYSFDYSKVAIIISDQYETIANMIFDKLDRGVTYLDGRGGYLGTDTEVILSVISNRELAKVEKLVHEIDPTCFMVVSRVSEVRGRGFSISKKYE